MILTLIAHERNLGIVTLTDYLLNTLGKEHTAVVGANYLVPDLNPILEKVTELSKTKNHIIFKYAVPKNQFSNHELVYPSELNDISDFVLRVPRFIEEKKKPVPLIIFKGEDNPIVDRIKEFYKHV